MFNFASYFVFCFVFFFHLCVMSLLFCWFIIILCLFLISLGSLEWFWEYGILVAWISNTIDISNLYSNQVGLVVFEISITFNEFEFFVLVFILIISLEPSFCLTVGYFCEFFIFLNFFICFGICFSLRLVGWLISLFICCVDLFVSLCVLIVCFSSSFFIIVVFDIVLQTFCLVKILCVCCYFVFVFLNFFVICWFMSGFCLQMVINEWIGVTCSTLVVLVGFVVVVFDIQKMGNFVSQVFYWYKRLSYYIYLLIQAQHLFQRD